MGEGFSLEEHPRENDRISIFHQFAPHDALMGLEKSIIGANVIKRETARHCMPPPKDERGSDQVSGADYQLTGNRGFRGAR